MDPVNTMADMAKIAGAAISTFGAIYLSFERLRKLLTQKIADELATCLAENEARAEENTKLVARVATLEERTKRKRRSTD